MSDNKGVNITSYLLGSKNTVKSTGNNGKNGKTNSVLSFTEGVGEGSSITRIVSYVFAIVIILFIILLFVHFFITPIFSLHPGAPGIIAVPGWDDGVLFWSYTNPSQILNRDLPIHSMNCGYSLIMDILIQNPMQFSKQPRVFFSRGGNRVNPPTGDTLLGIMNQYNVAIGLLPDTNDLIVSVLNKNNHMENVIVSNVPIQESFRLGVVVMENALEVYMNGRLIKTRTFSAVPMDVKGDIYPAMGVEANMAKIRNLKIWPRILTTSEIRYAKPERSPSSIFEASPIPTSTSCVSQRMMQLSVDTVPE